MSNLPDEMSANDGGSAAKGCGDAASSRQTAIPAQQEGATATSSLPEEHKPEEFGGPKGPEPTRYGDWEKAGRCIDF